MCFTNVFKKISFRNYSVLTYTHDFTKNNNVPILITKNKTNASSCTKESNPINFRMFTLQRLRTSVKFFFQPPCFSMRKIINKYPGQRALTYPVYYLLVVTQEPLAFTRSARYYFNVHVRRRELSSRGFT